MDGIVCFPQCFKQFRPSLIFVISENTYKIKSVLVLHLQVANISEYRFFICIRINDAQVCEVNKESLFEKPTVQKPVTKHEYCTRNTIKLTYVLMCQISFQNMLLSITNQYRNKI